MTDIGNNLRIYLKTKTSVTDMIGSGVAARIYPDDPKQGAALPYIVYEVFEGESYQHLEGISGLATARIQVDAYGTTRDQAYTLAENIRLAPLAAYRGQFGDTFCHSEHGRASYDMGHDRPIKGDNKRRYWFSRDYIVTYSETTQ